MAAQLDSINLDWAFFDALATPPDGIPYSAEKARRRHGRELTKGELGCFSSHMTLWRWLVASEEYDQLLVLEDDLLLDPVFFGRMDRVAREAAAYDYLRLYALVPSALRMEGRVFDRYLVRSAERVFGTQGYFLTKRGARSLCKTVVEVVRPVDDELDRFWVHRLPIRTVFPSPIIEMKLATTIEADRRKRSQLSRRERAEWLATRAVEKVRRWISGYIMVQR